MNNALPILFKELKLSAFARHWEKLSAEATSGQWTYAQLLTSLCELEITERYSQRVQRLIKESSLPKGKTFSTLSLSDIVPDISKQIKTLQADMDWVRQARNLLLLGSSGLGKTHIACAFAYAWITEKQGKVKYFPATALVQLLQQAKRELNLMAAMTQLDKYELIVLDDIGYVRKTEAETSVLFEFIAHRYESGSLIITANQPFSEWDSIFTDSIMTVAAVDRLIHHASIIQFPANIESRRKKEHNKGRHQLAAHTESTNNSVDVT